jgi:hypothetical protein
MADIAYEADRHVVVTERQLQGWRLDGSTATLRAEGPCPACRHEFGVDILADIVSDTAAITANKFPPERLTTRRFSCGCLSNHPNRPATVLGGCGRWWLASVLSEQNGDRSLIPAPDEAMAGPAVALDAAAAGELTAVRAWGEKWLPAVAAVYGLFSVAGLVVAKDTVSSLPLLGRLVAALFIVIGAIATLYAIDRGYRAAFGWLKVTSVSNDAELTKWYEQRRIAIIAAPLAMGRALRGAKLALGCLFAAVGVLWFWPPDATPPIVSVTYNQDGDTSKAGSACGDLKDSKGGVISVVTTTGSVKQTTQIAASWVTGLTVKEKC